MKRSGIFLLTTVMLLLAMSCSKLDEVWKKGHPSKDSSSNGMPKAAHIYIGTTLAYDYTFSYNSSGMLTGASKHQYAVTGKPDQMSIYEFVYRNDSLETINVNYLEGSNNIYKQKFLFVRFDNVVQRQQINYDAATGFAPDSLRVYYNFRQNENGKYTNISQTCIKGPFTGADPCIGSSVNDQYFATYNYDAQNNVPTAMNIHFGTRYPSSVSNWDSLKNPFAMKGDVLFLLNESVLKDNQHFDVLTNVVNQNLGGQPAVYTRNLILQTNNALQLVYLTGDPYLSVTYDFDYTYRQIKGLNYPARIDVNRTGELAASDPPKQDYLGSVTIDY